MPRHRAVLLGGLILSCLALPSAVPAANVAVDAGGASFTFSPSTVTIQAGDTVTWTNRGGHHNVAAADGSFRSGQPSEGWVFSHTFTTAGTYDYFCEPHASSGMQGRVVVQAATGGQRGTLRFNQASYSASEGTGSAAITVSRVNGDDGPVSVVWTAAVGTATAGADFAAAAGTLNWADGDDDGKTFAVTVVDDALDEPNETVHLTLSNPGGGAALDSQRKTAVLTLLDNDAPAGTFAAPTNLRASPQSTSEILLSWDDNAGTETGFRIERKALGGAYQEIAAVGANVTSFAATGLEEATFYSFRVRAANGAVLSAYSNEAGEATLAVVAPCQPGPTTLCINGGRFRVEVAWRLPDRAGAGQAVPVPSAPDSGLFYFFGASNLEMLIKVLNACGFNNRYWVFYAATTNVEITTTVTDTQNGRVKVYFNPLNVPAPPVQDTSAFATCP